MEKGHNYTFYRREYGICVIIQSMLLLFIQDGLKRENLLLTIQLAV